MGITKADVSSKLFTIILYLRVHFLVNTLNLLELLSFNEYKHTPAHPYTLYNKMEVVPNHDFHSLDCHHSRAAKAA